MTLMQALDAYANYLNEIASATHNNQVKLSKNDDHYALLLLISNDLEQYIPVIEIGRPVDGRFRFRLLLENIDKCNSNSLEDYLMAFSPGEGKDELVIKTYELFMLIDSLTH